MDMDNTPLELQANLDEGCGLIVTKDVQVKDKFLEVPQNLILSTETADQAGIGKIKAEPIQKMPSVKLAVFLLLEKNRTPKSFWKEYIDVLPRSMSLPLFWKPKELLALKGTSIYGQSLQQQGNTLMQYLHIRKAIQAQQKKDLAMFTYEEYRWAVGIVMSRQNYVPVNGTPQICLIPLWDMLNHDEGVMTTFYNQEEQCTQCFAMRNYKKGDQMFIYYGERANAMLLLYQGFVFSANRYRTFTFFHNILDDSDKFKKAKEVFLMKHKLKPNNLTAQTTGEVKEWRSMVALRNACATMEELKAQNAMEDPVGQELSLKNEVLATEKFLESIAHIKEWKAKQYPEAAEFPDTLHVSFAKNLKEEEEETLVMATEQLEAYRSKLRKRERKARQRANKKAKLEEQKILASACDELD